MATSSWRVEDLQQLEEYGLAGQLESTSLEAGGEGRGCGQSNGDQDWYCMSEVLSDLLTDVQPTPQLPFMLPLPADSAHPQHRAAVEVTLNSPTAYGMRTGSGTVTYINKGQPYEIVLRANLQDTVLPEETLYKCVLSLGFSELRMRNSEQDLFERWGQEHPCERLLEIDKRGCDGLSNIQNGDALSVVSCVWQPVQRGILSVKVNCLSSEFAAKKHGGEKGILLQLSADVLSVGTEGREKHILRSACNIKVFKDKGGDRKQKTDQMKMEKLPAQELAKYLPSHEVTHFNLQPPSTWSAGLSPTSSPASRDTRTMSPQSRQPSIQHNSPISPLVGRTSVDAAANQKQDLSTLASVEEAHSWLSSHNFTPYLSLFANYCGEDLLRLSRRDIVELCGPADGIRLFNALRSRTVRTLYVCVDSASVYQAVCLERLTAQEMLAKLSEKVGLQACQVSSLLHLTSSGILVLVDDTVVENFQDEECFVVQPMKEESGLYQVVLRSQSGPAAAGNGLSISGNSPRTAHT